MRHTILSVLFSFFFITPLLANEQLIIEPNAGASPLIQQIQTAQTTIDLVMYGFTDLQFADALIDAKDAGKTVNLLIQHIPYRAHDENLKAIRLLKRHKIDLVYADKNFQLTHQKTFIIDRIKALIMTFNLTHSAFKNERNFALLIDDPEQVAEIERVFTADRLHQQVSVSAANLVWSPDNSRSKLMQLISNAHASIRMYAEGLSDYQIIGALAQASRKGVSVTVLTSNHSNNFSNSNRKFDYLRDAGVKIMMSQHHYIHAKAIIVDDKLAEIGSINFTKPSIDANRELGIITTDSNIIKQLNAVYEEDAGIQLSHTRANKTANTFFYSVIQHLSGLTKVSQMQPDQVRRKRKRLHRYGRRYASSYTSSNH